MVLLPLIVAIKGFRPPTKLYKNIIMVNSCHRRSSKTFTPQTKKKKETFWDLGLIET